MIWIINFDTYIGFDNIFFIIFLVIIIIFKSKLIHKIVV